MSQYRVRNWSEYNKSLKNRGSLSFWLTDDAVKKWKARKDPQAIGAPKQYSEEAILCLLVVKAIYHLPYRQLEGFITYIFAIMQIALHVPHFTTIAERSKDLGSVLKQLSSKRPTDIVFDGSGFKVYGEGEWKVKQHGKQKRRRWKKFHIGICPKSHEIIVAETTELETADCEMMPRLLERAPRSIKRVLGDGAFDTENCYKAAYEKGAKLVAPPRQGARLSDSGKVWWKDREEAVAMILGMGSTEEARKLWKKLVGYHDRSLVETCFSRMKGIFGDKLSSRRTLSQANELRVKAYILNQMTKMGMPKGMMV